VTGGSPFLIPTYRTRSPPSASGTRTSRPSTWPRAAEPGLPRRQRQRVYLETHTVTSPRRHHHVGHVDWARARSTPWCRPTRRRPRPQLEAATAPVAIAQADDRDGWGPAEQARYLQLPHPDARVTALAQSITKGIGSPGDADPRSYAKVEAIDNWMAGHIRYTTDIRPWRPGPTRSTRSSSAPAAATAEQISTATVVMLRSLGIPAREAVG